jgi:hypothetical protein
MRDEEKPFRIECFSLSLIPFLSRAAPAREKEQGAPRRFFAALIAHFPNAFRPPHFAPAVLKSEPLPAGSNCFM